MGRSNRLDVAGAWHHVMNRGAGRQVVFHTRRDGELFESLIGEESTRTSVEVHAYCLMPNHFHLLVHCPDGGLSRFVQHVVARFTRATNQRTGRDGALFRGRFHSIATGDTTYVERVLRYIHRNPIDIATVRSIETYRWSSLRAYLEPASAPAWLRTDVLDDSGELAPSSAPLTPEDLCRLIDLLIAAHLDAPANEHRAIRRAICVDLQARGPSRTRRAATELAEIGSLDAARKALPRAHALMDRSPDARRLADIVRDLTT